MYIYFDVILYLHVFYAIFVSGGGDYAPRGDEITQPVGGGQFLRTSHMYIYFDVIFAHVIYTKNLFQGGGITDPRGWNYAPPGGGGKFCVNLFIILRKSIYNVIYIPHVILNIIIYILCKKLNKDIFSKFLSTLI